MHQGDGAPEILGIDVASGEEGTGRLAFLYSWCVDGLAGVQPVSTIICGSTSTG